MEQGECSKADFDPVAERYDTEVRANPSMRYMRTISLVTLQSAFSPGQRVLEIGCGTGEEAVTLARAGIRIVATDPAANMLTVTERRVSQEGLGNWVETRQLAAGELGMLLWEYGEGSFDGAYSSFGPLNGESSLRPVATALAALVKPGGLLVASVMNRFYLFEAMWYLVHAQPGKAARRWRGQVQARISSETDDMMRTWYHTPGQMVRDVSPHFELTYCRALPFLLPPPYAASLWSKHARFWERIASIDEWLAPRWPFRALGDHFLIVLRRSGGD
jgi:SAM-dependent methyltransferase